MSQIPRLALGFTPYRPKMVWDYPEYDVWVAAGKLDELACKFDLKPQDFSNGFHLLPFQASVEYLFACREIPGLREAMEADGETMEGYTLPGDGIDLHRANEINNEAAYAAIIASGCEGGDSSDTEEAELDKEIQVEQGQEEQQEQEEEEEEEGLPWVSGVSREPPSTAHYSASVLDTDTNASKGSARPQEARAQ